jgi:hypothetical protein
MWMPHYGVARRLESIVELAQKHEGNNEEMIHLPEDTFVVIKQNVIPAYTQIPGSHYYTVLPRHTKILPHLDLHPELYSSLPRSNALLGSAFTGAALARIRT